MIEYIENETLRVGVNLLGGCLASIIDKSNGEELLYQPVPNSWQGQDVVIFPFVARLKGRTYTHKGKEYSLRNHGLVRYYELEVYSKEKDAITLRFHSNEETLKEYPFPFDLLVSYHLEGKTLRVQYRVENQGEETMPFGMGAHPAFRVDYEEEEDEWGLYGNSVQFDRTLELTRIVFDETASFIMGEEPYGVTDHIVIHRDIFQEYGTLALKGEGIDKATLIRKNGRKIRFNFKNIRYFILWGHVQYGDYVAIEPWMSLPDFGDAPSEIMKKKTLIHLEPGQVYDFEYDASF